MDEVLQVGSAYIDNGELYIITSVSCQLWREVIYVNYALSQNWSLISQYVGIDRKFRNWNMPAEILQRNLYDCDYCIISDKKTTNSGRIYVTALRLVAEVFKCMQQTTENTEINSAWFFNLGDYGTALNATSFAVGTSLLFTVKAKDNLSAGMKREKKSGSNYLCTEVFYTNQDGTLENLRISLASEILNMNTEAYPYCTTERPKSNYPSGILLLHGKAIGAKPYVVKKDSAEQLNFTYQLHFVSPLSDVVIGYQMCSDNPLVKQWTTNKSFKVWGLTKRLSKNAVKVLTSQGIMLGEVANDTKNTYFTVVNEDENIKITVHPIAGDYLGWAITDGKNNLILGQNKTPSSGSTLFLGFAHNY